MPLDHPRTAFPDYNNATNGAYVEGDYPDDGYTVNAKDYAKVGDLGEDYYEERFGFDSWRPCYILL